MDRLVPDDLADSPLPEGPLSEAWGAYLSSYLQGRRSPALVRANRFLALIGAEPVHRTSFAEWVCTGLFDRSDFWSGQWGGGLILRGRRWERPVEPALTFHPISSGVVLPYLVGGLRREERQPLRWTYQFAVGQLDRLLPVERDELRSAIADRCGPDAALIDLLRHATGDSRAMRMLRDIQDD
ncbi:hypothetical protein [Actinoplanes utahensis]|uniref:hypothetical protein n=1 Tax=Actinoplanes utahensis TaxID=1869 RepID=UPI0005BA9035|nr:hypothetical protein [Actinoplanes utahensis]GIF31552.1 hypothetical protein Aut01nite_45380 [Actinoplanes utahensis]